MNGYSTEVEETGFFGVTLYGTLPEGGGGYGKSINGNTQVILNSRAPAKTGTVYQAHENYGHKWEPSTCKGKPVFSSLRLKVPFRPYPTQN